MTINFNPPLGQPFKVPRRRTAKLEPPSMQRPPQEQLESAGPGYVQGKKATDIENNFFIAIKASGQVDWFEFQPQYIAMRGIPGGLQLDYILSVASIMYPFFLDGEYWHRGPEQQEEARREVDQINDILDGTGAYPAQRIPGDHLKTIELAKQALDKGLSGYYIGLFTS